MALVEKYHVVAAIQAVHSGATIYEGQVVSLNTSSEIVLCNDITAAHGQYTTPYGIAGDTQDTAASYMPGVASGWQNRVSDYFDETSASARMTVYHSGGEFATDRFATNVNAAAVMTPLYVLNGDLCLAAGSTASGIVAYLTKVDASYPSGVPGVDINGDMALSSNANNNTYIEFKLVI